MSTEYETVKLKQRFKSSIESYGRGTFILGYVLTIEQSPESVASKNDDQSLICLWGKPQRICENCSRAQNFLLITLYRKRLNLDILLTKFQMFQGTLLVIRQRTIYAPSKYSLWVLHSTSRQYWLMIGTNNWQNHRPWTFKFMYHQYPDDTQLLTSCKPATNRLAAFNQ